MKYSKYVSDLHPLFPFANLHEIDVLLNCIFKLAAALQISFVELRMEICGIDNKLKLATIGLPGSPALDLELLPPSGRNKPKDDLDSAIGLHLLHRLDINSAAEKLSPQSDSALSA